MASFTTIRFPDDIQVYNEGTKIDVATFLDTTPTPVSGCGTKVLKTYALAVRTPAGDQRFWFNKILKSGWTSIRDCNMQMMWNFTHISSMSFALTYLLRWDFDNFDGYLIDFSSYDNTLRVRRIVNGVYNTLTSTAYSTWTQNTWYQTKVTIANNVNGDVVFNVYRATTPASQVNGTPNFDISLISNFIHTGQVAAKKTTAGSLGFGNGYVGVIGAHSTDNALSYDEIYIVNND